MQLALLAGCHVVATCGSPAKAERLKGLGAHRVINYKEEVPIVLPDCHGHTTWLSLPVGGWTHDVILGYLIIHAGTCGGAQEGVPWDD